MIVTDENGKKWNAHKWNETGMMKTCILTPIEEKTYVEGALIVDWNDDIEMFDSDIFQKKDIKSDISDEQLILTMAQNFYPNCVEVRVWHSEDGASSYLGFFDLEGHRETAYLEIKLDYSDGHRIQIKRV